TLVRVFVVLAEIDSDDAVLDCNIGPLRCSFRDDLCTFSAPHCLLPRGSPPMSEYSIHELCERCNYARRTVAFFVRHGFVRPPALQGRNPRYPHDTLLRLLAIKALRRRGFFLNQIKHRLARMNDAEIAALAAPYLPDEAATVPAAPQNV